MQNIPIRTPEGRAIIEALRGALHPEVLSVDLIYAEAHIIIWTPDDYPLDVVAGAAEYVLGTRGAPSGDVAQATYLITTMHPYRM